MLNEQGNLARRSLEPYSYDYLNQKYYSMMVNLIDNSFINYVNKEYQKINISETDKILKEEFKLIKKRKPSLV